MRYLQRELVKYRGVEFNISTTSLDLITWQGSYAHGYREPRYPVPMVRSQKNCFPLQPWPNFQELMFERSLNALSFNRR